MLVLVLGWIRHKGEDSVFEGAGCGGARHSGRSHRSGLHAVKPCKQRAGRECGDAAAVDPLSALCCSPSQRQCKRLIYGMHGVHGILCLAYTLCIHLTFHSHPLQFIDTLLTLPLLIIMLDLNNIQHNRHRNMDTAEMSDRFEQHQRLKLHVQSMRTCSFRAVGVMRAMAKLSPALRAHQGTCYLPHHFTLSRQSVLLTTTHPLTIAYPI
jgi:hypothetical protein